MRTGFLSYVCLSCILCSNIAAEDVDPTRFEKDIAALEGKISAGVAKTNQVLFLGSSSIRKWDLRKSFPGQPCLNHGFGGSHISDVIYHFDRVVTSVRPSAIVFYAGDNDIGSKKTPETVAADFQKFAALVEAKVPECKAVLFIAIKPSVKRWELRDKIVTANAAVREICEKHPKLHFVDVWSPMLNAEGQPQTDLLVDDGLHMSDAGYEIWTRLVVEKLQECHSLTP